MTTANPFRLGVLVSHPIQYYVPWFRHLANRIDLDVFYAHRQDGKGQSQAGFGVEFEWDVPLLEGYRYRWLQNVSRRPGLSGFNGCDTPELAQWISPDRFDAFLVIGWNRKCNWQAIRACWKTGVPVLMRGDSQLRMTTSWIKSVVKAIPYRYFLPRIDCHLYVGERNREYLRHYGVPADRLWPCPHFVDNDFFATRAAAANSTGRVDQLRMELGIPSGAFVAMFVGKLIDKKHPRDFVAAVLQASQRQPKIHGVIVGSGPLEEDCRRLAGDSGRIHFAGFRNQTQLPECYAAADTLVLPSEATETWGLVVNEAMACGTPAVVSSACGCAPDLIDPGQNGFLFDLGDVSALADRLVTHARLAPDVRAGFRQRARDTIAQFTIEKAATNLIEAITFTRQRKFPNRAHMVQN